MSSLADQLMALAKHTGAPDVVEDAAHTLKSLEGVRAERDILQEIVDEQRGQIAKLVSRVEELTLELVEVREERRHAVAALSEELDRLRAERDEARRRVCENAIQHGRVYRRVGRDTVRCETPQQVAEVMGWDCYKENKENTND